MTKIYVASFATCNDFDAQMIDDGGYDSVADMAMGCTAAAGLDRQRVIDAAKLLMTGEALDMEELTPDDELTFEEQATTQQGANDDHNLWWTIDVSLGADPYGVIIIRELDAVE